MLSIACQIVNLQSTLHSVAHPTMKPGCAYRHRLTYRTVGDMHRQALNEHCATPLLTPFNDHKMLFKIMHKLTEAFCTETIAQLPLALVVLETTTLTEDTPSGKLK